MKKVVEGRVIETYDSESFEVYGIEDVSIFDICGDILEAFNGKRVRITIEEVAE